MYLEVYSMGERLNALETGPENPGDARLGNRKGLGTESKPACHPRPLGSGSPGWGAQRALRVWNVGTALEGLASSQGSHNLVRTTTKAVVG